MFLWNATVDIWSTCKNIMLIGEYRHTIDDKRRVALPAKFRRVLGKKLVMTRGLDSCLFIFSETQWGEIVEKLQHLSMGQQHARAFGRYLFSGASEVEIDQLGRVLVPAELADHAKLSGRAVLIGVNDRCEVWGEKAWDAYKDVVEKEADEVAEKLGDIGVL
jgi:MraZ protein